MKKDFYINILILQVAFSTLVVLIATFIRFFGGGLYNDLKTEYDKYFTEETTVEDFFSHDKLSDFLENNYKVIINEN